MKKKNYDDVPSIEILRIQHDSNFASSFGGQIGDGTGSIKTNSLDKDDYEND